ncbi:hypothetical protein Gogos_020041, partial [Gossypium gossypioides]|nr:hypothetical protein [Gossypium gossypioides]
INILEFHYLLETTELNGGTSSMMKNMIQNIWIIFSIRIQDFVSLQPRIKPQQNSFKHSRQLVRC